MAKFKKVSYSKLNSKQKENFNFHNLASVLATFGFNSIWLNDDVQGADFLAVANEGAIFKIQLKGRLTFDKKYKGKDIYVAFPNQDGFCIYPHDDLLEKFLNRFNKTKSWQEGGMYSFNKLSKADEKLLLKYFLNYESKELNLWKTYS